MKVLETPLMRFAIGIFVAALSVTPALAAPPVQADVAQWVVENTDLAPGRIAIAGADNVYAVEPLGAPTVTGEVIAHVRTEALKAEWRGAHGFQSWDAHVIFDCRAARMRVIRSASYPLPNRQGEPKIEDGAGEWLSPQADEPAAKLLASACDDAFDWPMREEVGVNTAASRPLPAQAQDAVSAATPAAETVTEPRVVAKPGLAAAGEARAAVTPPKAADAGPAVAKRRFAPLARVAAVATSCKRLFFDSARSMARLRPESRRVTLASQQHLQAPAGPTNISPGLD